jgi:hypothetical protein
MSTDTNTNSKSWRKIALRCAVIAAAPLVLITACGADNEASVPSVESSVSGPVAEAGTAGLGEGTGCWTEWKVDGTSEALYGDLSLAPVGSTPLDCEALTEPADSSDETPAVAPSAVPAAAVQEDEPGFDCRTNGNRTCGPDNADGVAPGCYVDGQLAEPWWPGMYGRWINCGPITPYDEEQQARLDGEVAQVCSPNAQGGVTCDWADAPAEATVPAEDGTEVPVSFYDRTDYNRDGVVDQEQGFGPNPSPAEVQAG